MTVLQVSPLTRSIASTLRVAYARVLDVLGAFAETRTQDAEARGIGARREPHLSRPGKSSMSKRSCRSPMRATSNPFLIGKNRQGQWVVRDQAGLRGGLFINRIEALKFAMFENGHRPEAVIMAPGLLELGFGTVESATSPVAELPAMRRAA